MIRNLIAGILLLLMLGACSSKPTKSDAEFKGDPAEINAQLGIEYMRQGMYEAASEKLNKAVKQNPGLQLAQVSLAILNEKLGEDNEAGKHYRKAYGINRKDPVTLNAYGQFLCRKGELAKAEEFGMRILKLCVLSGGTITGEHGVGIEKLDAMCDQFNNDELELFHALKQAFDADLLLNPGKAVPSLHRCAELGAMHVHGGKLPFPDLPRF